MIKALRRVAPGNAAGFSLMEVVIAIAVMAVLAGAVGPLVFRQLQRAKEEATRQELETIRDAVEEYHSDTGTLPAQLASLVSDDGQGGWAGPYLGSDWSDPVYQVTVDAFEKAYSYVLNPTVLPAGSADLIIASSGINRSLDLPNGSTWNLSNIGDVDDIVVHISATRLNREKRRDTVTELEALAAAARNYYRDNDAFPGNLSALAGTYIDTGYRNDAFGDEWTSTYESSIAGSGENAVLSIWSRGPDRQDDDGADDDLLLQVNASAINSGNSNDDDDDDDEEEEEEEEQSETEREVDTLQAALDANPQVRVGSSISGSVLRHLGLSDNYRKDEWNTTYRVTRDRQVYSCGPDRNRRTTNDNIPNGVGG